MDIELIQKLSEASGVSGFESNVREIIKKEIEKNVDWTKTDNMGNLIAFRKGSLKKPKKVAFIAHMDEIGFFVKRVNNGFIEFTKLGGIDDRILLSQKVIVHAEKDIVGVISSKPIHLQKKEEREKLVKCDEMHIDIGNIEKKKKRSDDDSIEESDGKIKIEKGTPISFYSKFTKLQETVYCGKSFDNRLGVYCLIDLIKNLKKNKNDIYFVFSTQEEVGLKGARTAVFPIEPDLAIAIDTAVCGDVPSVSKKESEIALLRGPAISLIQAGGSGAILPESLRKYITDIANKNKIKYQFEMIDSGMTEAAIVQMLKDGILCCSIGIPIRNTHTPFEIFDSRDVDETLKLVELIEEEWK